MSQISIENHVLLESLGLYGCRALDGTWTFHSTKPLMDLIEAARQEGAWKWINIAAAMGNHEARALATEGFAAA